MKVQIDVTEWWTVSYQESFQNFDQREGSYTSWRDKTQTFITEAEALELIDSLKIAGAVRNITIAHVAEIT